jgi:cytochrome oxidase assembly protein ShyY1
MSRNFPFLSFFICFTAVIFLCFLGHWQVERLAWKNNLQRDLDQEFAQDISKTKISETDLENITGHHILRGALKGSLDFRQAISMHGYIADGRSVSSVVVPLYLKNGTGVVAVDIGCGAQVDLDVVHQNGRRDTDVYGIARLPQSNYFTPQNSPMKGDWWRMEPTELAAFWHVDHVMNARVVAEIVPDFAGMKSAALVSCPIEKDLRNDHLSYAVFWFMMAGVLSVMWGVRFLRPALRAAQERPD